MYVQVIYICDNIIYYHIIPGTLNNNFLMAVSIGWFKIFTLEVVGNHHLWLFFRVLGMSWSLVKRFSECSLRVGFKQFAQVSRCWDAVYSCTGLCRETVSAAPSFNRTVDGSEIPNNHLWDGKKKPGISYQPELVSWISSINIINSIACL